MIGRIIKRDGGYSYIELEDIELLDTMNKIAQINTANFVAIYNRVSNKLSEANIRVTPKQHVDIAIAIYNNVALKSFPVLAAALSKKINSIKENSNNKKLQAEYASMSKEQADLIEEQVAARHEEAE